MRFEEFVEAVSKAVEEQTGEEVAVREVRKNNGVVYHGLNILRRNSNSAPSIYLEGYYGQYEDGMVFSAIVDEIIRIDKEHAGAVNLDVMWFKSFENIKQVVFYKLINYEKNRELLKDIPHERYLDLAKVYYVCVQNIARGMGTILVNNSHVECWGVDVEEIKQYAEANTEKLMPAVITPMSKVLIELMISRGLEQEDLMCFEAFEGKDTMFVASNADRLFGAAVMSYERAFERFAKEKESDLYILPSAVHELILVPCTCCGHVDRLKEIVREVNRTQLIKEEILSDNVYLYERGSGNIRIV